MLSKNEDTANQISHIFERFEFNLSQNKSGRDSLKDRLDSQRLF